MEEGELSRGRKECCLLSPRIQRTGQCESVVSIMVTLQDLAFVNAMATVKLSPPVLQEVRKAMAAKNGAQAIGASKIRAPTLQVSHRQRATTKRKGTLDAVGEPAACRPATEPLSQSNAPADASAQRPCPEPSTSRGSTPATGCLA